MKFMRNIAVLTAVLGANLPMTGPAHAELLVMPYSCQMAGGRPQLTPSDQQGHRVLTRREDKAFTACSHANPGLCRTFTLHRFTIDCGGAEVPFVSVAAASLPPGRAQAWLEGGRLLMRMPQSWNLAPDDPCVRGPAGDPYGRDPRLSRYCADKAAFAPPPVVELPAGFAPMFGLDGIFVADHAPASASAGLAAAGQPVPAPKPAVALPKRKPDAPVETKVAAKSAEPGVPALAPALAGATVAPEAPASAPSPPVNAPGTAAVPEVINRPEAAVPKPAIPSLPLAKTADPAPQLQPAKVAAGPVVSEATAVRSSINEAARAEDMAATRPVKITAGTSRWWPSLWSWMAAGLVTLAGGLLWLRREKSTPPVPMAPRDFASVSLLAGGGSVSGGAPTDENGVIVVPEATDAQGSLQLHAGALGSFTPRPRHDPDPPGAPAGPASPIARHGPADQVLVLSDVGGHAGDEGGPETAPAVTTARSGPLSDAG